MGAAQEGFVLHHSTKIVRKISDTFLASAMAETGKPIAEKHWLQNQLQETSSAGRGNFFGVFDTTWWLGNQATYSLPDGSKLAQVLFRAKTFSFSALAQHKCN